MFYSAETERFNQSFPEIIHSAHSDDKALIISDWLPNVKQSG